jgi:hypothetical protein
MEDKFSGQSAMDYFLKAAKKVIKLACRYFLCLNQGMAVYFPDNFESVEKKLLFFLTAIDEYFYSTSEDRKKTRICQKADLE